MVLHIANRSTVLNRNLGLTMLIPHVKPGQLSAGPEQGLILKLRISTNLVGHNIHGILSTPLKMLGTSYTVIIPTMAL